MRAIIRTIKDQKLLEQQKKLPVSSNLSTSVLGLLCAVTAVTSFSLIKKVHAAGYGSLKREEIPDSAVTEFKALFEKHAKKGTNGRLFMNYDGFISAIRTEEIRTDSTDKKYQTLFSLADKDKDSLLTFEEFLDFEILMTGPDADYRIAFELFDVNKDGTIDVDEFQKILSWSGFTAGPKPLDMNSDWIRSFFGSTGKIRINYQEFTQLLKSLEGEVLRQAFEAMAQKDPTGSTITGEQFEQIFLSNVSRRIHGEIPKEVKSRLRTLVGNKVSYPQFVAFYNIIKNLDRVREGILQASEHKNHPKVTQMEFLRVTRRLPLLEFTPLEADMVYKIFDSDSDGYLALTDFPKLGSTNQGEKHHKSFLTHVKEGVIHFSLGSVAGATGAAAVYPIDLVKTRMQNQRYATAAEKLYQNSFDCFVKVVKGEGVLGLYRGLPPQLVGVAPEKAIKLTVNDLLRGLFGQPGGHIYLPLEILAGGCAGCSQVIFTNPIEIVKIRLQVQGEAKKFGVAPKSTFTIIKELGFRGLYKGAAACLLRDIPFSAIYFPSYAKFKQELSDPTTGSPPSGWNLLIAGALAGVPAASLVTPADVIKTRLQVEARTGQQTYQSIPHCAATVYKQEGFRAFWKGAGMRVFRSSPQFGVTLLAYEMLQRFFVPDMANPSPPTNAPIRPVDYDYFRGGVGRSLRRADERWGLFSNNKEK